MVRLTVSPNKTFFVLFTVNGLVLLSCRLVLLQVFVVGSTEVYFFYKWPASESRDDYPFSRPGRTTSLYRGHAGNFD